MLGAITGDIIGSVYEFDNIKTTEFDLFCYDSAFFTDDSILTIALADAILHDLDYADTMRDYSRRYPHVSYGTSFFLWARTPNAPAYNSWGNGAAMRISPVGYAFATLDEVQQKARAYTEITHNHPEGIKGALATASAIFLARTGHSKQQIKNYIVSNFGYDLNRSCDEIRPHYYFKESCQETVPEAVIANKALTLLDEPLRAVTLAFMGKYCPTG